MHEVLVNRLGGLSLPRKSVVRLTDRPDMTLDVNRGRKTKKQQQWRRRRRHAKTLTFSNISVITEDIYLKIRIVVHYQKGNPYQ